MPPPRKSHAKSSATRRATASRSRRAHKHHQPQRPHARRSPRRALRGGVTGAGAPSRSGSGSPRRARSPVVDALEPAVLECLRGHNPVDTEDGVFVDAIGGPEEVEECVLESVERATDELERQLQQARDDAAAARARLREAEALAESLRRRLERSGGGGGGGGTDVLRPVAVPATSTNAVLKFVGTQRLYKSQPKE